MRSIALAGCVLLLAGCGDKKTASDTPPGPGQVPGAGAADPAGAGEAGGAEKGPRGPELADSPTIDLLANRFLWHLYRDDLVVPVGSEGFRKYVQEYNQPWGATAVHDGKRGRVLGSRAATITIPVREAGQLGLAIRMHGLVSGQKMTLRVNGKIVANLSVPAEWSVLHHTVSLRAGENDIQVLLSKRGSVGGKSSYGLFHSFELGVKEGEELPWPKQSPVAEVDVAGTSRQALTGFDSLALYVEIPPSAHLVVTTGADNGSELSITAHTADGKQHSLLDGKQEAGQWTERRIALAELADQLVRLELSGDVAWAGGRIALEKAEIAKRPPPVDNVILFVVDALRSDRLSIYAKTRVETPRIAAETDERGYVLLHNQAASPSSPPSHGSIQTGMIPRVHGVTGDSGKLYPGTPMISTQADAAGIAAAYYGNNPFGMGRLKAPGKWTAYHVPPQEGKGIDCTALVEGMLDFAGRTSKTGKRFFMSALPYEPHTPYRYHEGISDKFHPGPWPPPVGKSVDGNLLGALSAGKVTLTDEQWQQLFALYDGEVEHMDMCFGQLLDGLESLGIGDKTAIVLTSDHGEGMYEHGKMGHAFGHYRELGDVPFVIYADGWPQPGRKFDVVTSHLDIAPTVLDLLGVEPSERIQGESVLPLLLRQGPWTPRVMPLEYGRSYSLRARRFKILADYQNNQSVFDLDKDPTEQDDLVGKHALATRYLRDLTGFFLAHRSDWRMHEWGELNNHTPAFAKEMAER